jgi:peptidoglycan/LPS O-acetylase OafA/YrhL
MPDSRLLGADFIRAAACLLVLSHHLAQRLGFPAGGSYLDWVHSFAQVGTFGVSMFFVLSGFLLARPFWLALDRGEPMPSLRTYALRRAARIVPGFWLALWVTFVVSVALAGRTLDDDLVLRALAGMFLVADWHWLTFFPVELNGPLWSISVEATSYVLLPLGLAALFAVRAGVPISRVMWLFVIAAAVLAYLAYVVFVPIDDFHRSWEFGFVGGAKWWMPRFNPFGFFSVFAIGSLAAGIQVLLARRASWIFDIAALIAAAGGIYWLVAVQAVQSSSEGWGWFDIPYGFPWFPLIAAAFLATSPQSRLVGALLDNPPVRYLARISFGIYVWHYLVLEIVRVTLAPDLAVAKMDDPTRFLLSSALVFGISALIADLSFRFLERPVMRWARRYERRPVS